MARIQRVHDGWQSFHVCICRYCNEARWCEQATCHRHWCLVFKVQQMKEER